MLNAILDGTRAARRSLGLVVTVWAVNLMLAAALALPLMASLEGGLAHKDAAGNMLYGFDYSWWSRWSEDQSGWAAAFRPEIFGIGFAFRNVELLLRGELPARLLAAGVSESTLDPVIGLLGLLYLLVQTFLLGGILGVYRSQQGAWTARGLLHGSGFYFGRLLRIAAIALACDLLLLHLNVHLARWADGRALEAVSETSAMALAIGRHALLLLALLLVSLVSSYAKVIVVLEERRSSLLAFLSAVAFCLANARRVLGHYLAMLLMMALMMAAWAAMDGRLETTGYKTQLVAFALMQAFVVGRVFLRLSLLAGQASLYRRHAAES
jgi:hypothetical protein